MSQFPQKWQYKCIGEVCKTGSGGTPLKSKKEYYEGGNIPWILSGEVSQGEISCSKNFITEKGLSNSSAKIFPHNTVLVAMYGATAGQVGILRCEAATNQAVCGIYPSETLLPEYIFYAILSRKTELIATAAGNAQPNISQVKIKNTKIPIPPLPVQKHIVSVLDEAFEGIGQAIANTEKNLANACELFEGYLNKVFTQKGDGWEDKKLYEVLDVQPRNGWSPPAKNHSDQGTPVVTLSSVTGFQFNLSKIKYTSALTRDKAHYWLENDALLITRSNTPELVGHVAICSGVKTPTIYPDLIMKMKLNPAVANTRFIYYQLRTKRLRNIITNSAQGANPTMKKISKSVVQGLPIFLPDLQEQRTIVSNIESIETESNNLKAIYQQKLTSLKELKQSILQKAFTGELTADSIQ